MKLANDQPVAFEECRLGKPISESPKICQHACLTRRLVGEGKARSETQTCVSLVDTMNLSHAGMLERAFDPARNTSWRRVTLNLPAYVQIVARALVQYGEIH